MNRILLHCKLIMGLYIKVKTFLIYGLIAGSVFFIGCGEVLEPVEGKIFFNIREGHKDYAGACEPSIYLALSTEKVYSCYNMSIVAHVEIRGSTISIFIHGIKEPEVCLWAFGPATYETLLDLPPREYRLQIYCCNAVDYYTLIVDASSIQIETLDAMVTTPECELYWRYPPNSFAYLCGTTIETSWICDDFLDSMIYHVSIIEFKFPDSGEICYPRASQGHYYDMPARYFYYEKEADFDSAGAVLKRYAEQVISQYSGIGIHLIGWNNKDFMSWRFR